MMRMAQAWDEERSAAAQGLAPTLVGLPTAEAVTRASADGFMVEIVGDWVRASLSDNRIRLRPDDAGIVIKAWAG